jgi:hypothetical protein
MMRKLGVLCLATLALATACAEGPTAVEAPHAASLSGSGVYGITQVHATFTLLPGAIPPGVNQHPQGRGTCRNEAGERNPFPGVANAAYTVYFNEQGQRTGNSFCQGSAGSGQPVACTIRDIPAMYGAENSHFGAGVPEYLDFNVLHESAFPDRFVRYGFPSIPGTHGMGLLQFAFACADQSAGEGHLLLNQFNASANLFFNPAAPNGASDDRHLNTTGIALSTDRGAGSLTSMYWTFGIRH